uniref:Uncharacterized protein n=1 Tax=Setaria viridis TaxID=4556 RepID=A0A4U6W8V1_SETVI|nr:hypothetical protein SEVIR_2G278200v2 [Setaria viridis]
MIAVHLEEVVHPLREEASIIKLWQARVANHLECVMPSDMAELFGPYSPVHCSPTPSILTSLAAGCTSVDSLLCEDTCVDITNSTIDEISTRISTIETHREMDPITNEVATRMSDREFHQNTSTEHAIQDAFDDEEAILDAHGAIDDPIFLITIKDSPSYSMVKVKRSCLLRPSEELGCPPTHTPSPPSTIARRRCKSYSRSSLHRSARNAQHNVLKDLGILGNDGKLNNDVIQDYADHLKELLPPDDLKPLIELKGHAFLELPAELSLSLC